MKTLSAEKVSANGQSNKRLGYMSKLNSIVVGDSVTEGPQCVWLAERDQVFSKIGSSVMTGDDLFSSAELIQALHSLHLA